jgi:hypothetical protein
VNSDAQERVYPRLIVIEESVPEGLAQDLLAGEYRRFTAVLEKDEHVTVIESAIPHERVYTAAHKLAQSISRRRFYAHIVIDDDHLAIIFPSCVVDLHRDVRDEIELAVRIGEQMGIPRSEMRFEEMFDVDHPDLEAS